VNPSQITVARLFDVFVIDRAELEYQLRLEPTRVDCPTLLGALDSDKLNISLATLLAVRDARAAFSAKEASGNSDAQPVSSSAAGL
jgi:membrane protein